MLTGDHSEAIKVITQRIEEILTMRRVFARASKDSYGNKERNYTLWELDTRIERLEDTKNTLEALAEWGKIQRENAKR